LGKRGLLRLATPRLKKPVTSKLKVKGQGKSFRAQTSQKQDKNLKLSKEQAFTKLLAQTAKKRVVLKGQKQGEILQGIWKQRSFKLRKKKTTKSFLPKQKKAKYSFVFLKFRPRKVQRVHSRSLSRKFFTNI
jgi:hypothetical protein